MSALAVSELTLADLAPMIRDRVKDKSYRAFPMGQEAGRYLRHKRKRLTESSYRDYEGCLDKLARWFCDLHLPDFEPPVGTERIEEFLDQFCVTVVSCRRCGRISCGCTQGPA